MSRRAAAKAKLVIAKLDRSSRNLAFIATLMDSNVEFIAADNPHANRLTIHILAAVAEHERGAISERTKAALAAPKRRGVKLGGPRLAVVVLGRLAGVTAKNAAAWPHGGQQGNGLRNPSQPKHFREKYRAGGPSPSLPFLLHSPSPFAWRRTCSTQACSGEMPRTMPVTWARRLSNMRGWDRLRF